MDKFLHFLGSIITCIILTFLWWFLWSSRFMGILQYSWAGFWGIASSGLFWFCKDEIYDRFFRKNKYDNLDLKADFIGHWVFMMGYIIFLAIRM